MKFLYDDESFSFEALHAAGYAPYAGADLGEFGEGRLGDRVGHPLPQDRPTGRWPAYLLLHCGRGPARLGLHPRPVKGRSGHPRRLLPKIRDSGRPYGAGARTGRDPGCGGRRLCRMCPKTISRPDGRQPASRRTPAGRHAGLFNGGGPTRRRQDGPTAGGRARAAHRCHAARRWNGRRNDSVRSTRKARTYEPHGRIARVSPTPLLMIVGEQDTVTLGNASLAAYIRALQPKQLVTIPAWHFAPHTTEFARASAAATSIFRSHLAPSGQ